MWFDPSIPCRRGRFPLTLFLSLLFACVLGACGYNLKQNIRDAFNDSRGIYVPVFTNLTQETGAERVFPNALIRELTSRGDILLTSRAQRGLELRGWIQTISYYPTVLTRSGFEGLQPYRRLPTELGLNVQVRLELWDNAVGKRVWQGTFSGFRRIEAPITRTHGYEGASSVGLQTQTLVESRYEELARIIMRDVYDNIVAKF